MKRRNADSATYTDNCTEVVNMGWPAQWTYQVCDGVACFELRKQVRRSANRLEDEGDCAAALVRVSDRKGNPLTVITQEKNNELPRLPLFGNQSRFHLHQKNIIGQLFFGYYSVHGASLQ